MGQSIYKGAEDPVGMRGFNREIISIPNRLASQSSPFH